MEYKLEVLAIFLLLQVGSSYSIGSNDVPSLTTSIAIAVCVAAAAGIIIGFAFCYWFKYIRKGRVDEPREKNYVYNPNDKGERNRYETNPREGFGMHEDEWDDYRKSGQGWKDDMTAGRGGKPWGKVMIIRKGDPDHPENAKGYDDRASDVDDRRKFGRYEESRTDYMEDRRDNRRAIQSREVSRRAISPPEVRRDMEPYTTTRHDVAPLETTYSRRAIEQPSYTTTSRVVEQPAYTSRREIVEQPAYTSRREVVEQPAYTSRREVVEQPTYTQQIARREIAEQPAYTSRRVIEQPYTSQVTRREIEQPAYTEQRYVTSIPAQSRVVETPIAAPIQREVVYVRAPQQQQQIVPVQNEILYESRAPAQTYMTQTAVGGADYGGQISSRTVTREVNPGGYRNDGRSERLLTSKPKAIVYDVPRGHNVEEFAVGRVGGRAKSFKSVANKYVPKSGLMQTGGKTSNIPTMFRSSYKDDFF